MTITTLRSGTRWLLPVNFAGRLSLLTTIVLGLLWTGAVGAQELRDVRYEFIPETGCPVTVVGGKTQLEVDSFGAPIACRIYIDYKNSSDRPVSAVKFRIGYSDPRGAVYGMFHAPDADAISPGAQGKGQWRGEKIDPRTSLVKIRVLTAKYSDGSVWESEKMRGDQEKRVAPIAKPAESGGASTVDPTTSSDPNSPPPAAQPPANNSEGY